MIEILADDYDKLHARETLLKYKKIVKTRKHIENNAQHKLCFISRDQFD